jgi:cytochrome oxidase Cu insertion factor (SCO1/SenC/PrrC family)
MRAPAKISLWLLFVASVAPFAAGWFFFLHPAFLPGGGGGANHGELIDPVRPIDEVLWKVNYEKAFAEAGLRGKWILLFASPRCDGQCRKALWKMRQIRLALGEDRKRVNRLLLLPVGPSPELARLLTAEYPQMAVVNLSPQPYADLATRLGMANAQGLFVLDPFGNVMMRYRGDAPAADILDDMKRLLKVSQYWGSP